VREGGDESRIVRWFPKKVRSINITREEGRLRRPASPIRLNPFPGRTVHSATPQADPSRPQGRVGDFKHDAAHVLIGKIIVTGELQFVQSAQHVEEKGIAAPTSEEAEVTGVGHPRFQPPRNRRPFDDNLSGVFCPGGFRSLNAA
jgi:hypothetical protein